MMATHTKKKSAARVTAIGKALAHEQRRRILTMIAAAGSAHFSGTDVDGALSPRELSTYLEEPLGNTSYHVRALVELGALRMKKQLPRRGAVAHFYELTKLGTAMVAVIRAAEETEGR